MLYDATVDDEGVIGRRRCIDDNSRVIDAPIMLMDGACFDCHFSDGRSGQAVPLESVEDEAISSLQTSIEVCRLGAEFFRLRGPQICCNISGVFGQVSEKTTDRPSQSLGESLDIT